MGSSLITLHFFHWCRISQMNPMLTWYRYPLEGTPDPDFSVLELQVSSHIHPAFTLILVIKTPVLVLAFYPLKPLPGAWAYCLIQEFLFEGSLTVNKLRASLNCLITRSLQASGVGSSPFFWEQLFSPLDIRIPSQRPSSCPSTCIGASLVNTGA